MEYYVFDNENTAVEAEKYICTIGQLPKTSVDINKNIVMENQETERWAIPNQRLDGKWVFPVIPNELLQTFPQNIIDNFNSSFLYVKEEFQNNWFNQEDD